MIPFTKSVTSAGIVTGDVYSEEYSARRIYLTGQIDAAMAGDICAQINHLAAQGKEDIYLIIQSSGGSVSAGMSILDTMETCGCDICTIVMGEAASMGALLAACGTKGKRRIGKRAEMMIHQPLGGASGQASDIERVATHITRVKQKLHKILSQCTGQSYRKVSRDCDRDFWMDASEAVEYGLVDGIFTGYE